MKAYLLTVTVGTIMYKTVVIAKSAQSAWNKYLRGRPINISEYGMDFNVHVELISHWVIQ